MRNTLYYGDNLDVLREHIPAASVDLVYLDPPFNSNRNYNVLYKDKATGAPSEALVQAFVDTWEWGAASKEALRELQHRGDALADLVQAMTKFVGKQSPMMAYIVMMAVRLVELHRVLKPTGSLYLHCDPTASHYLKVVMDTIFGPRNFRNEIVWRRKGGSALADMNHFSTATDFILFYSKTGSYTFNTVYVPLDAEYIETNFTRVDDNGRRFQPTVMRSPNPRPNLRYDYKGYKTPPNGWAVSRDKMEQLDSEGRLYFPKDTSKQIYKKLYLDEHPGQAANNLWSDIPTLKGGNREIQGYPTQKPVALLERIVAASSNPGDVVLDPFCGCGTTIAAAQKLGRNWIGIDITHLAVALQKYRLKDGFGLVEKRDYDVHGEPVDLAGARQLAADDKFQFQWWAVSLVGARPYGSTDGSKKGKKGADGGIDGVLTFEDEKDKVKRLLVQVKGGHVSRPDVAELRGTIEREGAAMGLFITLEEPTKPMLLEADSAGEYFSPGWQKPYPRLQIRTVADLLHGKGIDMPPANVTFARATREQGPSSYTLPMDLG